MERDRSHPLICCLEIVARRKILAKPHEMTRTSSHPAVTAPTTNLVSTSVAATELRPWGSFTVLEEGRGYKIKRIEVKPGHRLSLQMHYHRSEHWIVVSGTAKVNCGEDELVLSSNQSTYVPQCT